MDASKCMAAEYKQKFSQVDKELHAFSTQLERLALSTADNNKEIACLHLHNTYVNTQFKSLFSFLASVFEKTNPSATAALNKVSNFQCVTFNPNTKLPATNVTENNSSPPPDLEPQMSP